MLAAASALPGVAAAQPGLSTGLNPEGADRANRIEEYQRRELMGIRKTGIDAHYLMGVAKLGLQKWDEAKTYLEAAVKQEPKRPEPKSRLGVTYVKLNDVDSATKQRAELAAMDKKCKGNSPEAAGIAEGLALLDRQLAAKAAKP